MLIARVIGEVVATQKHPSHEGRKILLVQPLNLDGSDRGDAVVALDAVDAAFHAYEIERNKPGGGDPEKLAQLEKAWKDAQEQAGTYVVNNEFGEIVDQAGGVGLNSIQGAALYDPATLAEAKALLA